MEAFLRTRGPQEEHKGVLEEANSSHTHTFHLNHVVPVVLEKKMAGQVGCTDCSLKIYLMLFVNIERCEFTRRDECVLRSEAN
jgi:hypothetical protein